MRKSIDIVIVEEDDGRLVGFAASGPARLLFVRPLCGGSYESGNEPDNYEFISFCSFVNEDGTSFEENDFADWCAKTHHRSYA